MKRHATFLLVALLCAVSAFGADDLKAVGASLRRSAIDAECQLAPTLARMYRQHSMAAAAISNVTAQTYSGTAKTPTPGVLLDGAALAAGTDFTFSYTNNVDAGTAALTITAARAGLFGSQSLPFEILPADMSGAAFPAIEASTNVAPTVATLSLGGATLSNGVHYVLSYSYAGTTNVTATGIGNYAGTATTNFTINAAN